MLSAPPDPPRRRPGESPARVLVTGLGLATGLGIGREATWDAIRAGRSAAKVLDRRAPGSSAPFVGCPLPEDGHPGDEPDPIHRLLLRVAGDAIDDAALETRTVDWRRVGVVVGLSKGGLRSLSTLHASLRDASATPEQRARSWVRSWPGSGASLLAGRLEIRGPTLAPVAACATGVVAVLQGADLIRRGVCDVVLAGSVDASLEPLLLAAFRRMRVEARDLGDPTRAVRPWDRARSGFVVGEGGAILVLERADHARARGVLPYAEVAGGALGADAYHETDLDPDPSGLAHVIGRALERAGVPASELDHVNVHGTATRANDPLECRALRLALGIEADRAACSANKSQVGHLLGAAGAAELALTCLAIRDGFVPPTLNLDDPDPACDLDATPHVGRVLPIRAALKVSIGFGGHLAAAVLRRPEAPRREAPGGGDG